MVRLADGRRRARPVEPAARPARELVLRALSSHVAARYLRGPSDPCGNVWLRGEPRPHILGFLEGVWQPLLAAAKLPYRKPHAMRHSYATWMLEAGADLRWVRDQLGHASIEETEGTYVHLERERHEGRVDLD